ncbi:hypothetical protein RUND412_008829, partial [Rhizina undulata]
ESEKVFYLNYLTKLNTYVELITKVKDPAQILKGTITRIAGDDYGHQLWSPEPRKVRVPLQIRCFKPRER